MMFTWARKHIRLIRYYSATRRRTVWTKAIDIGLAASVFLSLPMTWVMDQLVLRDQPPVLVSGKIFEDDLGSIFATLNGYEFDVELVSRTTYLANFDFRIDMTRRGWPFVTSTFGMKPLLNMDVFAYGQGAKPTELEINSIERMAISQALINAGYNNEVGIWDGTNSSANDNLATWAANVIIWTIILAIASWVSVWIARFAYIFLSTGKFSRKLDRQESGLCTECGYDLRGNEFGERCPECGVLTS